jgi:cadmium resistance protein CadD (predicted permease)
MNSSFGLIGKAVVLFAVTNIDDLLLLALFFARGAGHRGAGLRIAAGQYAGFVLILAVAMAGAFGATLLPDSVMPYLGLLPLSLGLRAAWHAWRDRHGRNGEDGNAVEDRGGPTVLEVSAVTFANGGDNIGVYVPVFATAGTGSLSAYVVVFFVLLAVWVAAGRFVATRPIVTRALSRWGHVLLPGVLIAIGLVILVDGLASR